MFRSLREFKYGYANNICQLYSYYIKVGILILFGSIVPNLEQFFNNNDINSKI